MNLASRWSRHVLLVVGAAVLLGLATLIGGLGTSDVPAPVRAAFERAVEAEQVASVSPDAGGADVLGYTSYRGTGSVAEIMATVRLWTDDGSGRVEQESSVSATLERTDDGGWSLTRSSVDVGTDAR